MLHKADYTHLNTYSWTLKNGNYSVFVCVCACVNMQLVYQDELCVGSEILKILLVVLLK